MTQSHPEPDCFEHYFITKGKPGAPGTMWQECEMCGKTFKQILAKEVLRGRIEGTVQAQWFVAHMNRKDAHYAISNELEQLTAELEQLEAADMRDGDV